MKRSLYFLLAILCVTHAVLVSFALITSSVRALILIVATVVWFVWPVIFWRVGAKKWRLALPLLLGFVALLPCVATLLVGILMACTPPRRITPFASSSTANYDPRTVRGLIIAAAPKGWSAIRQYASTNSLFSDPKTEEVTLVGPEYFDMVWKDNNGLQHQDKILRESLQIWIVPGDFKLSLGFKYDFRFEEIFASPGACVYACSDSIIEDTKRLEEDLGAGVNIGETPPHSLSWKNWREDIAASLKK